MSLPSTKASSFPAISRSRSGSRADSSTGSGAPAAMSARPSSAGKEGVGHSSMIACAFAPPAPKEDRPAMRGRPCHAVNSCCNRKGESASARFGFGTLACSVGASWPWRICSRILVRPAMPAAASSWPILDFTEPSAQKPLAAVSLRKAWVSPSSSIGSPSAVPVPCASMQVTASAVRPAFASVARITSRCAAGLGTV